MTTTEFISRKARDSQTLSRPRTKRSNCPAAIVGRMPDYLQTALNVRFTNAGSEISDDLKVVVIAQDQVSANTEKLLGVYGTGGVVVVVNPDDGSSATGAMRTAYVMPETEAWTTARMTTCCMRSTRMRIIISSMTSSMTMTRRIAISSSTRSSAGSINTPQPQRRVPPLFGEGRPGGLRHQKAVRTPDRQPYLPDVPQ